MCSTLFTEKSISGTPGNPCPSFSFTFGASHNQSDLALRRYDEDLPTEDGEAKIN